MIERMEIKIFDGGSLRQVLKKCLQEGYIPATLKQITKLKKEGKAPMLWYDTSTMWFKETGEIRDATLKELENIEDTYCKGGRVLYLGSDYNGGLGGVYSLGGNGQVFGVKTPKVSKKVKK